ncbi:hypothetical protein DM02DRAFT_615650, partial [Periconia macrospinosa]
MCILIVINLPKKQTLPSQFRDPEQAELTLLKRIRRFIFNWGEDRVPSRRYRSSACSPPPYSLWYSDDASTDDESRASSRFELAADAERIEEALECTGIIESVEVHSVD